jgi:hypothetical protein
MCKNIKCQNVTCYITFLCRIKDQAENCALHQQFLAGEAVLQLSEEDIRELSRLDYLEKFHADSSRS